MDIYVSNSDYKFKLIKENNQILEESNQHVRRNLLIVTPIAFFIVDQALLKNEISFSFTHYSVLLLIQNIGYYFVNKEIHRNKSIYWIHKFENILIPSAVFAVSTYDFLLVHVLPFIVGSFIVKPTTITFSSAVGTVAFLNLIIYTQEFVELPWIPGLVSPLKYYTRHKLQTSNYSTPLLDTDHISSWEYISKKNFT